MPALDVVTNNVNSETTGEQGPINPVVGITYPPPEVRNIIDTTASFVARNGPEFEAHIRQNPKFNFLNTGDPYHAYYQHKVKDFQEGKGQEPSAALPAALSKLSVTATAQQKQQEILKSVEQPFIPKDPPSEFEFIADPPSISALNLDIVKLTAQFVARNGPQFLTHLMNREQRNFHFDFLRPQHSLFQYFTKLLEQYTCETTRTTCSPTNNYTTSTTATSDVGTTTSNNDDACTTIPPMRPPPLMMAAPPPMASFVTPMAPQMTNNMTMNVKHGNEGPSEDEPANKKLRNENSLIAEAVFLARNTSPVTIKVTIPMAPEKSEWKLNGQTLTFTFPLSESVANVKAKIQDELSMPPAKQKLFYDGMFFKDSNTLAYYNITPGAAIQLQVKERGGRKK